LAALIVVSLTVQPDARWMYQWGFTLVDAAGALLCVALLDRGWGPSAVFSWRPSAWLGRMSYALYLWHPPVFVAVIVHAPKDWPVGFKLAVAWVITFAGATVSYYFVETPFLKLKGRLSSRAHGPSSKPATSGAAEPAS
jgi:peptidoglycan/LPS O-acetylase OafA/YrhL